MRRAQSRFVAALSTLVLAGCVSTGLPGDEGGGSESATARPGAAPVTASASAGSGSPRGSAGQPADGIKPEHLSKTLTWRSIGPANMGGRVADVCFAPGNAKTFFVAYGTSGLFKSTNNGVTLTPVFDKEATASIGSVVVCDAPSDWPGWNDEKADTTEEERKKELAAKDPEAARKAEENKGKAKIVWVGTGEGNNRNSSSWGNGVYRSTDGGATWTHCGLGDSHNIPRLAVDPRNPDVCYAACLGHLWGPNAERGLYKTSDGGRTWTASLQVSDRTGATDVILDPADPDTVYCAMYTRERKAWRYTSGSEEGGIFKSTNAGRTWTRLTNGLPKRTGNIGLDVCRKNPKVVYAIVESDDGGWGVEPFDDRSKAGGVFRSEDAGETWTRMSPHTPRAFYFSKVRVDPDNDQRVYVLGWGLWISDDGGKHFRTGGARKPHGDMHAMAIDPADPDHLLMGTDGGVYLSWDKAGTWDFLDHVPTGEFYNIAIDGSDPYRVAGGLQDNGSWFGVSASNSTTGEQPGIPPVALTNADWKLRFWGDGYHVAFDPTDPNIIYAEWQGGNIGRIHLDTGVTRMIKPSPKEGEPRFRFNWNSPFFISPHNGTTLYFGGNYVFKLTDRGDRWERISEDLSTRALEKIEAVGSEAETHGTVVTIAESPVAGAAGVLWAGTDDGLIHVTTDDGRTWTNVTPPEVNGWYVSRIEPSHHDRDTAYVSVDGHRSDAYGPMILMTGDLGRTWANIAGDLPADGSVKCVREDRRSANVLYAGTERGFFASLDRGGHWLRLNGESLPTVAVDDIQQHPRDLDLVIGTHGRSIFILDDASPLAQLTADVWGSGFHLFDVPDAKPRQFLLHAGLWGDGAFGAPNPPMGARVSYWLGEDTGESVSIAITDIAGVNVRTLTGGTRPGLNRVIWDLQREPYDRINDPTYAEQPQFVPQGEYTVTVTRAKEKAVKKVRVLAAPAR
ncbi:MAG: hypothetical protein ACKVU4_13330 [Phycisphaerales bacterium]